MTIPLDIPFSEIQGMVRDQLHEGEGLATGLQRLEAEGSYQLGQDPAPEQWSEEQARAMTGKVWRSLLRRSQSGSIEISEWLRRQLSEELSSGLFSSAGFSPTSSSARGRNESAQGFWFTVNAELMIHGATEPGAAVTVDGRPIQLRPDGTFSLHHLFPDGSYHLPLTAVSVDGRDKRAVELHFQRQTEPEGDVGQAPQSDHLQAPTAA